MDANGWVAAVVAAIALVSLVWVRRAANAAREQTAIQRQLRIDAAQPYVWVDIRPDDEYGQLLLIVVGNSGPTVATDVRVALDPLIIVPREVYEPGNRSHDVLTRGIASLPPGRQLKWTIGPGHDVLRAFKMAGTLSYLATVQADGPFGRLEPLTYTINLEDLVQTLAVPHGTPNGIAVTIKKLTLAVEQVRDEMRSTRHALAPKEDTTYDD